MHDKRVCHNSSTWYDVQTITVIGGGAKFGTNMWCLDMVVSLAGVNERKMKCSEALVSLLV